MSEKPILPIEETWANFKSDPASVIAFEGVKKAKELRRAQQRRVDAIDTTGELDPYAAHFEYIDLHGEWPDDHIDPDDDLAKDIDKL